MKIISVEELKDQLTECLIAAQLGEEITISDATGPIARIAPPRLKPGSDHEASLVARGILTMPEKEMDWDAFFAIGSGEDDRKIDPEVIREAVAWSRGDW